MKKAFFIITGTLAFISSEAQIFFSNGATVQVNSGAIVHCNGGMEITNSSAFVNDGDITITKNSTLPSPGNFEMNTSANVSGDGLYQVEQDWINDATFSGGSGTVELFGDTEQFITSTNGTITTFNHLTLTGAGAGNNRKKTLLNVNANSGTNGILTINDRELSTDVNSFFVLNSSTAAVTNNVTPGSEGFVSSIAPGFLSRETNSASVYVFPTGSSVGTTRYRPIEVTPTAAAANTYTVRMINNDPNTDGFNRSVNDGIMCELNPIYYHAIQRSAGVTSADIKMFYINAADGSWTGMAHWRTTNTMWNDMSTMTYGVSGVFNTVNRSAWLFANPGDPYVLTTPSPAAPVISCPSVCENSSSNIFTAAGSTSQYGWTLPSNGTLVSGQGNSSINVDWTTGAGYIYVVSVDPATGCESLPDSCLVSAVAPPDASFTGSATGSTFIFEDQTSGSPVLWDWDFGDGNTSNTQNPINTYPGTGTYTVTLIVANAAGCTDSVTLQIFAGEVIIPNVFSPNADGTNDIFALQIGGLDEYKFSVFDRWGLLMFESIDVNEGWDGKNLNGKICPDGTYYFILKAVSPFADYSRSGHITILTQR